MATINIGAGNQDDAFYRYKMPKLVAKIEGRGNGIKTNVVNNVDIAKSLERPPEYVLKYFGYELGAQTNFDKSTGTCIVNGAHDSKKLSEFLEGFIKKYVQCYSCGNPETTIKIKKENIMLKCRACGFVSEVDARLRLNGFIIKNPPEIKMSKEEKKLKKAEVERVVDAEKAEKREKKEKKEKKKDKEEKKRVKEEEGRDPNEKDEDESASDEAEEDGVVWMTDTSAEAAKQRAQEQLTAATAAMVTQGNIEAEQRKQEEKERKEKKRIAEEEQKAAQAKVQADEAAAKAEQLSLDADGGGDAGAGSGDESVQAVRRLLAGGADAAAVAAELKAANPPGGIPGRMRVLVEAMLGAASAAGKKLGDVLSGHAAQLRVHAKGAPSQLALLIALEHYLAVTAPGQAKQAPLAFKALYDAELVEEDIFVAWSGKDDAAACLGADSAACEPVRRLAEPFVSWLQEADETEESD